MVLRTAGHAWQRIPSPGGRHTRLDNASWPCHPRCRPSCAIPASLHAAPAPIPTSWVTNEIIVSVVGGDVGAHLSLTPALQLLTRDPDRELAFFACLERSRTLRGRSGQTGLQNAPRMS